MNFNESKVYGDVFENKIIEDITNKLNIKCLLNDDESNYKYYDIILVDKNKTIECKHDLKFKSTGRFVIETHCNGNESGILTTKADYWILGDLDTIYIFKTEDLKRCIDECYTKLYPEEPTRIFYYQNYDVQQSDGRYKPMNFFLINIKVIIEYCGEYGEFENIKYISL
jgi:hypothetical protein